MLLYLNMIFIWIRISLTVVTKNAIITFPKRKEWLMTELRGECQKMPKEQCKLISPTKAFFHQTLLNPAQSIVWPDTVALLPTQGLHNTKCLPVTAGDIANYNIYHNVIDTHRSRIQLSDYCQHVHDYKSAHCHLP